LTVEEYEARFTDVAQVQLFFCYNMNWMTFYCYTCGACFLKRL
jgi:hypothetical protein